MIYYRVKPEKDNVPKRKKGSLAQDGIYIGNELYGASIARHMMSIMVSLLAANKREQARELAVAWRA